MSRTNQILLIALAIIIGLFIIGSVKNNDKVVTDRDSGNTAVQEKSGLEPQKNEGGNVTVTVKPKNLKIGSKPEFEIQFETHSVDLSFDVAKQASLVDDQGKSIKGAVWNGTPPGGHHRDGTLSFDGTLVGAKSIDLIIKDVAGIAERKFKWNLQL